MRQCRAAKGALMGALMGVLMGALTAVATVSYTHLTLPTILRV